MTLPDIVGVIGVLLMLGAYALALLMNLSGALLVLISLLFKFNLSAFLMETAWALVAVFGLVKLALKKRP